MLDLAIITTLLVTGDTANTTATSSKARPVHTAPNPKAVSSKPIDVRQVIGNKKLCHRVVPYH
ncbi:hypothetical protein BS17DRAFT_771542 [Gyrodon lividus]|nr:hypothetical protein BS17DRAFT_771542 [Gyrodon lividus]